MRVGFVSADFCFHWVFEAATCKLQASRPGMEVPIFVRLRAKVSPSKGVPDPTVCYTIVLPGRKSAFRARFLPDSSCESLKIAFRQAEGRPDGRCGGFPDWNPDEIRSGRPISGPEALLHNIEQATQAIFYHIHRFGLLCSRPGRVDMGSLSGRRRPTNYPYPPGRAGNEFGRAGGDGRISRFP